MVVAAKRGVVQVNVRLPAELVEQVDRLAAERYTRRSSIVALAVSEYLRRAAEQQQPAANGR